MVHQTTAKANCVYINPRLIREVVWLNANTCSCKCSLHHAKQWVKYYAHCHCPQPLFHCFWDCPSFTTI